ncbi:MAG: hypothetical protein HRT71_12775 [Flavobacteriales bacterium]|nr:hypothetical protein [Flavobacteriales bacterium]
MRSIIFLSVLTMSLLFACNSSQKAYQGGNYDSAVLKAVRKLRKSGDNKKAIETLSQAYPAGKNWHLNRIEQYKSSSDVLKWEKIAAEYGALNRQYEEINRCPACMNYVMAENYSTQKDDAINQAAEVRYSLAEKSMENKLDRTSAKDAYMHYQKVGALKPGYKDVVTKMGDAKYYATLKVVLDPLPQVSKVLEISNEFFQNKISEMLHNMPVNEFVRFYSPKEAKMDGVEEANHVIQIRFDDFIVGNELIKEKSIDVTKDSVVVGTVKLPDGTSQNAYNTVKATFHTSTKTVISTGILDFKIINPMTDVVLTQQKFPGKHEWQSQWGYFNGDERALSAEQKKVLNVKQMNQPPPQELFVSFTQPIFDQLALKIQAFYANY